MYSTNTPFIATRMMMTSASTPSNETSQFHGEYDDPLVSQQQQQYICINGEPLKLEDDEEKEEYNRTMKLKRKSNSSRRRRQSNDNGNSGISLSRSNNNSVSSLGSLVSTGGQYQNNFATSSWMDAPINGIKEEDDEYYDDDDDTSNDESDNNNQTNQLLDEQEQQEMNDEIERCRQMDIIMGISEGDSNFMSVANRTSFVKDVDPETGGIYDGPMINGIKHHVSYSATDSDEVGDDEEETYFEPASFVEPKKQSKFLGIMKYNKPHKGTWITPSYTYTGTVDVRGKFHDTYGVYADQNFLSTYEGEYVHGYKHGIGKETYDDTNFTILHGNDYSSSLSSSCPCHCSSSSNKTIDKSSFSSAKDVHKNCVTNPQTISFGSVVVEYKGSFKRGLRHGLGTMTVRQSDNDNISNNTKRRQQMKRRKNKRATIKQPNYRNEEEQTSNNASSFVKWFRNNNNTGSNTISNLSLDTTGVNNDDDNIVYMYSGYWYNGKQHGENGCEMIWLPSSSSSSSSSSSNDHGEGSLHSSVVELYKGPFRRGKRHGRGILKTTQEGDDSTDSYDSAGTDLHYDNTLSNVVTEREGTWRSGVPVLLPSKSLSSSLSSDQHNRIQPKRDDDWTLRYTDGCYYIGQICSMCQCCPNGYGKMLYSGTKQHDIICNYITNKREELYKERQQFLEEKKQREETAKEARALLLKSSHLVPSSLSTEDRHINNYEYNETNSIEELLKGTNFTLTYEGEWHYGKRQGKGTCTYPTTLEELLLLDNITEGNFSSSIGDDGDHKAYEGIWMNDEPVSIGEKDNEADEEQLTTKAIDNTKKIDLDSKEFAREANNQQVCSHHQNYSLHHPYDAIRHNNTSTASTAVTSATTTTDDIIDWDDLDLDQENFDRFLEEFQPEEAIARNVEGTANNLAAAKSPYDNNSDEDEGWGDTTSNSQNNESIFPTSLFMSSPQQSSLLTCNNNNSADGGSYYLYPNGDIYRGIIDDEGNRQGRGVYMFNGSTKLRYEGEFLNNLRHGTGIMFTCKTKYIGEFYENKRSGLHGTFIQKEEDDDDENNDNANGGGKSLMYRGPFVNGKFHGSDGIMIVKDHDVGVVKQNDDGTSYEYYKGEWKYGKKCGTGEEELSYEKYFGEFYQNVRHGVGTLLDKDGNIIYSGSWKDGYMDGEGILYTIPPNKSPTTEETNAGKEQNQARDEFHGTFVRGKKSGTGKLKCRNGTYVVRGTWLRDVPMDGEWKVIDSNDGTMFSGFATCSSSTSSYKSSTQQQRNRSSRNLKQQHHNKIAHDKSNDNTTTTNSRITVVVTPIPNGFGTLRYTNGDLYTGQFVKGQREGRGVCVFSNGDRWDGTWKNDAVDVDGTGVLTLADGIEHVFGSGMAHHHHHHDGAGNNNINDSTNNGTSTSVLGGLTADDFPL